MPSLALGTGIVSLIDLTAAYTMFPGGGEVSTPRAILDVYDAEGGQVLSGQSNASASSPPRSRIR